MNTGIVAALVGVVAALLAWFVGRTSGKKETIKEVQTQEAVRRAESEKTIAIDTARIVSESAASKSSIEKSFEAFDEKLKQAEIDGNPNYMAEAAQILADIAQSWKDRNK